jgi:hypothetical protein
MAPATCGHSPCRHVTDRVVVSPSASALGVVIYQHEIAANCAALSGELEAQAAFHRQPVARMGQRA